MLTSQVLLPGDFVRIAEQAEARVLELCGAAVSGGEGGGPLKGVALLDVLDEISDSLCLVMDAAGLLLVGLRWQQRLVAALR